ncbi:hypothetical protein, partial [Facklamia sp. P12932]|uniref:hypothetical protein n=1 Tax=Facklamia sp. P12932 TaxID=3421947 RepID=UPI003D16D5A3
TPWMVACQVPLSMGFSRQEYWSRLPFPPPGDIPHPGTESKSPTLEGGFFTTEPCGKPLRSKYKNSKYYNLGLFTAWDMFLFKSHLFNETYLALLYLILQHANCLYSPAKIHLHLSTLNSLYPALFFFYVHSYYDHLPHYLLMFDFYYHAYKNSGYTRSKTLFCL